jgi:hypothetical protein
MDLAFIGTADSTDQAQQSRFASSVCTYNAHHFARSDAETDISQGPEVLYWS